MSVVLEVSANIWDIRYQSGMDCMRGHDILCLHWMEVGGPAKAEGFIDFHT